MRISLVHLILLSLLGLFLAIFMSFHGQLWSDFPVFYHAACIILDPNVPNSSIYSFSGPGQYPIYEFNNNYYVYSMASAYVFAPLAKLPYYWAKTIFHILDVLAYLSACAVLLSMLGAQQKWSTYTLTLSLAWWPFLWELSWGQINAFILLLLVSAVWTVNHKKPFWAGILIGVAAIFKLYPIAVAMLLGLRNWRIFAACITTFCFSLLLPGSLLWFSALANVNPNAYSDIYIYLNHIGRYWYWIYAALIGITTAWAAWRARTADYLHLTSLAIPAILLTSPVYELHYATILIFPLIHLAYKFNKDTIWTIMLIMGSVMVCIPIVASAYASSTYVGLFLFWILALLQLKRDYLSQYDYSLTS